MASSGTVTITSDRSRATITVPIADDTLAESAETLVINLAGISGATLASGSVTVTITDDDGTSAPVTAEETWTLTLREGSTEPLISEWIDGADWFAGTDVRRYVLLDLKPGNFMDVAVAAEFLPGEVVLEGRIPLTLRESGGFAGCNAGPAELFVGGALLRWCRYDFQPTQLAAVTELLGQESLTLSVDRLRASTCVEPRVSAVVAGVFDIAQPGCSAWADVFVDVELSCEGGTAGSGGYRTGVEVLTGSAAPVDSSGVAGCRG
ncbi:hypothetical protein [Candidatus Poriferisodalis sp.]|uniref:hypothetical protein n=1 Tax=Candidatus Poriferisodalis sp. TaxID=3101277 RepID=UPI003B02EB80